MPLLDKLRKHRNEILALAKQHGVENVRVFGSVARGEETPDSDIDLLIAMRYDVDPFGFLRFRREVAALMGRDVDVVFEKGIYHRLRDAILQEARPI
jgi:predicted nucleotidyltransferase